MNSSRNHGCFVIVNCCCCCLLFFFSGKINVKPLITHRFRLENIVEAFETANGGDGIKVMIECSKH